MKFTHLNGLTLNQTSLVLFRVVLACGLKIEVLPKVFVLNFNGDMAASAVSKLREEVTAVLFAAKKGRGDRVVCRIDSTGGTVSGYGHAAAQLERIKVNYLNVESMLKSLI